MGDNLAYLDTEFASILTLLENLAKTTANAPKNSPLKINGFDLREELKEIDTEFIITDIPQAISQSLSGIKDVTRIIRAMKEFSHPSSEQTVAYDIRGAIENTITITKAEWKDVAKIETDFTDDTPEIDCSPGAINQVLLNIVVNAAHAIDASGKNGIGQIRIKTQKISDSILIQISDTGTGIPEELKNRIFDPFFTTKDVGKGTGQGLAIAWDIIVKKHNGSIDVDSIPGEGTTFKIQLPIHQNQPASTLRA